MNNKLKMLVMSLVMQGIIKKYAKANVFFAFAYYLFAFAEFFCRQILSQSAILHIRLLCLMIIILKVKG